MFSYFVLKILNRLEVGELFWSFRMENLINLGDHSQGIDKADIRVNKWDVF